MSFAFPIPAFPVTFPPSHIPHFFLPLTTPAYSPLPSPIDPARGLGKICPSDARGGKTNGVAPTASVHENARPPPAFISLIQWRRQDFVTGGSEVWVYRGSRVRSLREDTFTAVHREFVGFGSVLFFSRPRSEGWPHHRRTFSIYPCPLSF